MKRLKDKQATYPPIIYFMIRNIYRNIIKEWEMVRKKVRGVIGG